LLAAEQSSKDAQLVTAEANIDTNTIAHFVRLRDRLASSQSLIESHVALSNFFTYFDSIIPSTIRFAGMDISAGSGNSYTITGTGSAASFNALAVASNSIGAGGKIKSAIFSNISVATNNTVNFSFTAVVDPSVVAYTVPATTSQTQP
jgi:hypothetical protein